MTVRSAPPHFPTCTLLSSHIFHFSRDVFLSFLFRFPLPHSFATFLCQRRVTPTATATAAAACHIKGLFYVTCCLPSFLGGNSSQVRVMELSLVICIKRQKLSQIALAHKHCLAVSACVTISFPGPETVQTAKTVDSQRKSLSKVNSWRALQKWRKGCTICCLSWERGIHFAVALNMTG